MNDHVESQPMSGRVALVAGASKGIGAATAEAFAAAGAAVVLAARDAIALQAVADGIAGFRIREIKAGHVARELIRDRHQQQLDHKQDGQRQEPLPVLVV